MVFIGAMLFVFVLIKVMADQLYAEGPNNAVSAAVSDATSSTASNPATSRPDPCRGNPLLGKFWFFLKGL